MPNRFEELDWERGAVAAVSVLVYGGLLVGWTVALLSTFYTTPAPTEGLLVKALSVSIPCSALAVFLLMPSSLGLRLLTVAGSALVTALLWVPASIDQRSIGEEVAITETDNVLLIRIGPPANSGVHRPISRRMSSTVGAALRRNTLPVRLCLSVDGGDSIAAAVTAANLRSARNTVTAYAQQCRGACGILWAAASQRFAAGDHEAAVSIYTRLSDMPGRRAIVQGITAIAYFAQGLNLGMVRQLTAASPSAPASRDLLLRSGLQGDPVHARDFYRLCELPFQRQT